MQQRDDLVVLHSKVPKLDADVANVNSPVDEELSLI